MLASRVGGSNLFDYYKHVEAWMEPWDHVGRGENPPRKWRNAFEDAYGMTVEEFYELFEEHRAAGFPKPEVDWLPEDQCDKETMDPGPSDGRVASLDREALATFFNATCGLNWKESGNWLTDAPIREWHGIRVDRNNRVIELKLQQNNLSGRLPPELGSLVKLRTLNLQENGLTSGVPSELGNLVNLATLWLAANDLSGEIPPELGNLTNLNGLSFESNRLTGEIPPELGNLGRLRWLIIHGNQLTGCVPRNLDGQLDPAHLPRMPFC